MTKTCIRVPLYGINIHLIVDDEVNKQVVKYIKRYKWNIPTSDYSKPCIEGLQITHNNSTYYIFIEKKYCSINTISHEIRHVIQSAFRNKCIEEETEAEAYLTGHVTECIFDFLLSKKLLINKYITYPKDKNKINNKAN